MRAWKRPTLKENTLLSIITWFVLGKQNRQVKNVYHVHVIMKKRTHFWHLPHIFTTIAFWHSWRERRKIINGALLIMFDAIYCIKHKEESFNRYPNTENLVEKMRHCCIFKPKLKCRALWYITLSSVWCSFSNHELVVLREIQSKSSPNFMIIRSKLIWKSSSRYWLPMFFLHEILISLRTSLFFGFHN